MRAAFPRLIQVRVSEELRAAVEAEAQARRVSLSNAARAALLAAVVKPAIATPSSATAWP